MLRLAIVGVGWAGHRQAQAVAELGRKVQLAALMDIRFEFSGYSRMIWSG